MTNDNIQKEIDTIKNEITVIRETIEMNNQMLAKCKDFILNAEETLLYIKQQLSENGELIKSIREEQGWCNGEEKDNSEIVSSD